MTRVLNQYFTRMCLLEREAAPDGCGGEKETWREGMQFDAALFPDVSGDALTAERRGCRRMFTVLTRQDVPLRHNDRIKRLRDGLTLRVVTDGSDLTTPPASRLKLCQTRAEAMGP